MHHRLNQHRHHNPHHPQPQVEDLRMRLNRMREQRDNDEAAGIPIADDSYLHNMPRHQRHAGFPIERNVAPLSSNRPVGKVEWDEGKTLNIQIKVSETGERIYKMDINKVLMVNTLPEESHPQGKSQHSNIIKNEHEPGIKNRGRGRYRGAPRGRGYFRGRGRGGFRGGRKPRGDRTEHQEESDTGSNKSSGAPEQEGIDPAEKKGEGQQPDEQTFGDGSNEGEYNYEEYQGDEDYTEHAEEHVIQHNIVEVKAEGSSKEDTKTVQITNESTQKDQHVLNAENLVTELESKLNLGGNKPVIIESKKCDIERGKKPECDKEVEKCDSNVIINNTKSIEAEIQEADAKAKNQTNE